MRCRRGVERPDVVLLGVVPLADGLFSQRDGRSEGRPSRG